MLGKRWIQGSFGFLLSMAVFASVLCAPTRKVEASGGEWAAGLIGGMAGLMIGSSLEQQNSHRRMVVVKRRYRANNQKLIMRNVLARYNPAYHDRFVEYVIVDLQGRLTPTQQRQVVAAMEQRQFRYMVEQRYTQNVCYR